ncbi:type II secretion system protein GspL [Burkholderia plantarii]|uniref:type II secretion system protein GspL n=1 Tax=Burkholderia plantarii TaxID=41899 RepID=UPI0018DB6B58|nr:type II secretion system protein GspL [Burkholderia plantarii]MBI0326809.1 type II secretion system protein GspL [Burkholderia plantarii]
MSTLIVVLPPREPAVPLPEWQWPELSFALLDKGGHAQRAGRSSFATLPQAASTVLVVAARDLLLLAATVPAVKGPKLRQALPNIVEDYLIQDPQTCHIAVDPVALPDGRRVLAVIDRDWFRFVVEAFKAAGHRAIRAVPATRCLPVPAELALAADMVEPAPLPVGEADESGEPGAVEAITEAAVISPPEPPAGGLQPVRTPIIAAVMARIDSIPLDGEIALAAAPRVELAIARGALGEGLTAPAASAGSTLAALTAGAPFELYTLGVPGAEPQLASITPQADPEAIPGTTPLPFDAFARRALETRFNLCQFDFEVVPWRFDRATLTRLKLPAALVAATLVVAVIGVNLHWWRLARERDAISAQITETLLTAFPKTTTVLDPPEQMTRQIDQLRIAAGELSPNDFLALASGVARSLGPLPANGIASLDYHDRRLDVGFKPQVKVDADFGTRLARNGLTGVIDSSTGKWTIRSGS